MPRPRECTGEKTDKDFPLGNIEHFFDRILFVLRRASKAPLCSGFL
jgi:hypothetical protein